MSLEFLQQHGFLNLSELTEISNHMNLKGTKAHLLYNEEKSMSLLELLDRIMNWIIVNQPIYAASFLPGLSKQEIDSICEVIPGYLSEDIYQLYQWRNGTNEKCPQIWAQWFHLHYQPLQEVIESSLGINSDFKGIENSLFTYDDCYLFPFSVIQKDVLCTLIFNEAREFSPVVVAWEAGVDTAFSNLTNMLEMLLEGLEVGVLFLNNEGCLIYDENRNDFRTLFYKYNSSDIEFFL